MRVVCVVVREENRIDTIDTRGNELRPQLRRSVDQQAHALITLYQRSDTTSRIARIRRMANGTTASDLRYSEARSGAEKGELHSPVLRSFRP
jgi:hypothetical protein